ATFSFTNQFDPSNADNTAGFHYAFSCTNGSLAGATYATSGTSASFNCTFADNGTYTVKGRIFDKDGGFNEYTASVQVNNVNPTVTATSATINENGTATVQGTITDPGTQDNFTVVITWGPGEGSTTLNLPAGSTTYSAT